VQNHEVGDQLKALLHKAFENQEHTNEQEQQPIFNNHSTNKRQPGDLVWVKVQGHEHNRSDALRVHWKGPYSILSTTDHTLKLQDYYTGQQVFSHLKNIKPFHGTPPIPPQPTPDMRFTTQPTVPTHSPYKTRSRNKEEPRGVRLELDPTPLKRDEYNVDEIQGSRIVNGHTQYLVKWEGYPESANTWEPASHFVNDQGAKTLALIRWESAGHLTTYQIMWGPEETPTHFHHCPSGLGRPAGTAAPQEGGMSCE